MFADDESETMNYGFKLELKYVNLMSLYAILMMEIQFLFKCLHIRAA